MSRADAYLDQHRAQLIEEAKPIVERWRAQGFFGKRFANIKTSEKNGGR